jgi:hypothetical protein
LPKITYHIIPFLPLLRRISTTTAHFHQEFHPTHYSTCVFPPITGNLTNLLVPNCVICCSGFRLCIYLTIPCLCYVCSYSDFILGISLSSILTNNTLLLKANKITVILQCITQKIRHAIQNLHFILNIYERIWMTKLL